MKKFKFLREEFLTHIKGRSNGEIHEILINPSPRELQKSSIGKNLGITITPSKDAIVFNGFKLMHKEIEYIAAEYGGSAADFRATWNRDFIQTIHFSEVQKKPDRAVYYAQRCPWLKKYSYIEALDIDDLTDSTWIDD